MGFTVVLFRVKGKTTFDSGSAQDPKKTLWLYIVFVLGPTKKLWFYTGSVLGPTKKLWFYSCVA